MRRMSLMIPPIHGPLSPDRGERSERSERDDVTTVRRLCLNSEVVAPRTLVCLQISRTAV